MSGHGQAGDEVAAQRAFIGGGEDFAHHAGGDAFAPRQAGAVFQHQRGGGDAREQELGADGGGGVLAAFVGGGVAADGEEDGAGDNVVGVFVHFGQHFAQRRRLHAGEGAGGGGGVALHEAV